jgi:hypothetical protein
MGNHATVIKDDGNETVSVYMSAESDAVLAIGERMNEIHSDAYMNGYNWEAFLTHCCQKKDPDALKEMETDSEAGTFVGFYPLTPANEARAARFAALINGLLDDETRLFALLEAEGDKVEWD